MSKIYTTRDELMFSDDSLTPTYMTPRQLTIKYLSIVAILFWTITLLTTLITAFSNPYFWVVFVILFVPSIFIVSASTIKLLGIKGFDEKSHDKLIRDFVSKDQPSVDIFLPICGEDYVTIMQTWQMVESLTKSYTNSKVYVLDDKNDPKMAQEAKHFGFNYITRNSNEFKKAGNLRNAFDQTNGEFILILDYDFCPKYYFLHQTLPYFVDPKVAIVQTPQAFDYKNETGLAQGAGNIQDFFYSIVQPARDTFGGAICVGTNAVYRRSALEEIGGNVLIEHSEDVWTGFTLLAKGFKIKYLPINLSFGLCPDDIYSYFKQQTRWAQGSSSLVTDKVFWQAKLTLMQRVSYLSGFLFYLYSIFILLFPVVTFIYTLYFNEYLGDSLTILLSSYILISAFVTKYLIYQNSNLNTVVAHCLATWSYTYALFNKFVLRKNEEWQPTGQAKVKKTNSFKYTMVAMFVYTASLAFFTGASMLLMTNKIFVFYLLLNLFVHTVTICYVTSKIKLKHF